MRRRLAAVLIADVAGYTRLMEAGEAETHTRLMALFDEIIRPAIATHHGRMVKSTGDGFLATFGSVNSAVQCAVGIQQAAQQREAADRPRAVSLPAWACTLETCRSTAATSMGPG
jgi:adenylate cyclase